MATIVVPAAPKAALLSSEQRKLIEEQKRQLETRLKKAPDLSATERAQLNEELETMRQKLAAHYRAETNRKLTSFV